MADGKLCQKYSCGKLSESDNCFSNYGRKCRGCFLRHSVVVVVVVVEPALCVCVCVCLSVCDKCPSCGRDNSGRCIGPHICCRRNSRCNYDTATCHKENLLPTPCTLPTWPRCGQQKLCVSPTQCCDESAYLSGLVT